MLRALGPPDATLAIVPATDGREYQVNIIECSETPIDGIPYGASNYKRIVADLTVDASIGSAYMAFNVLDMNPLSAAFGKNPITPVANICVPASYGWFKAYPGDADVTRTCGGAPKPNDFATFGLTIAYQLHSIAREYFSDSPPKTILDWGIGTGRVAVPLKRLLMPGARVIGVDVDQVNVRWCQENLADIEVSVSDFFPPLDLEFIVD